MQVTMNTSTTSMLTPFYNVPTSATVEEFRNESSKESELRSMMEVADNYNKMLHNSGTHIQVKIHDETNTIMVRIVNDETNEVIREIPKEKMLDMMYNMCVRVGVFLDEKM